MVAWALLDAAAKGAMWITDVVLVSGRVAEVSAAHHRST
jgi:hypothetical protein